MIESLLECETCPICHGEFLIAPSTSYKICAGPTHCVLVTNDKEYSTSTIEFLKHEDETKCALEYFEFMFSEVDIIAEINGITHKIPFTEKPIGEQIATLYASLPESIMFL
jgi:hypothetical protein